MGIPRLRPSEAKRWKPAFGLQQIPTSIWTLALPVLAQLAFVWIGMPMQYVAGAVSSLGLFVVYRNWRELSSTHRLTAVSVCGLILLFAIYFELSRPTYAVVS
ncbi:hypothetical protein [Rhodococcus kronopolitis]|uniref:Uncharacterized protein n=1 Tax=Rhodococcus kronopolitis TaxID=1460226 RepID=A0ABV9FS64_9NOCA